MENNFFEISKNNQVQFFCEGPGYYEKYLTLIRNSKQSIQLQTYIFMMDDFGSQVHSELIKASKRGVLVYLLVDSVGSRLLSIEAEQSLINAGIYFLRFNQMKIKSLRSWGRRLHHKILIVDNETGFIGGINVLSSNEEDFGSSQLDFALLLKGPVLTRIIQYCQKIFQKASPQKIQFPQLEREVSDQGSATLKILINDWVFRRWQITRQYSHLTKKAKNEITIINSYFFPRKAFMNQLVDAAKRGVKVRLILPKFSDWPSYILASEFLYTYFLKNGVEIYLWKKSILHGKLATIDENWATIGSFNLNYTSYQQNLEMNVNIYSEEFTSNLKKEIEAIIQNGCEKLDPKDFINHTSLKIRFLRFFYYIVLATIANFSIGVIFQESKKKEKRSFALLRIVLAIIFFILGIAGLLLPFFPGLPFLGMSFLLMGKQIYQNKKKAKL